MAKSSPSSLDHRHRFPSGVIAQAVRLYFKLPLSLRLVEVLLTERGKSRIGYIMAGDRNTSRPAHAPAGRAPGDRM